MLTAAQIIARVQNLLGPQYVLNATPDSAHPWFSTPPESWPELARFLRDDPEIQLTWLRSITGLDYPDKKLLCAAYDLMSFHHRHEICVKVFVPREAFPKVPVVPSVASVWRAADWHERETYDLLGINFSGHPDSVTDTPAGLEAGGPLTHPRRILLPDDWALYPLRKDYPFPREYQGIPASVELDWAQKPNYPK